MKYMHEIENHPLPVCPCTRADGTHTPALHALVCACVSQLVLGTHLAEAVCAWRPQVWPDNAEDGGRERNKEVTEVSVGTRPTVFKWKTIRNPRPPTDKMKPHGK